MFGHSKIAASIECSSQCRLGSVVVFSLRGMRAKHFIGKAWYYLWICVCLLFEGPVEEIKCDAFRSVGCGQKLASDGRTG